VQGNGPQSGLRYAGVMFASPLAALAVLTVAFAFALVPAAARADQSGRPAWPALRAVSAEGSPDSAAREPSRDGGVIDGEVVAVDHRAGTFAVQTRDRGRIDVIVLPSTNIQDSKNKFHTIADIERGERVEVFVSRKGPLFVAQIIHLR